MSVHRPHFLLKRVKTPVNYKKKIHFSFVNSRRFRIFAPQITIKRRFRYDIDYEFDDTQIDAIEATDLIDYFAKANVTLNDDRVNILGVTLTTN